MEKKMSEKDELLTSAKVAEKLGVTVGKIKKIITELNIEPDAKKGVCAYYNNVSVEKIKAKL